MALSIDSKCNAELKRTPLHIAAKNCDLGAVQFLLGEKANYDATDVKGYTPLHLAAKSDNIEIAEMLLNYGADVNAQSQKGTTPLHVAINIPDPDMVEFLLENGARVDLTDNDGASPLHHAARTDTACTLLLIEYGADVNARNKRACTPLHEAAYWIQVWNVKILLEQGSDINATTIHGSTPFTNFIMYTRRQITDVFRIMKSFMFHIVKLKAAGLYVSEENLENMEYYKDFHMSERTKSIFRDNLRKHELRCKKEFEILGSKFSPNFSIHDLLTTKDPRYTLNETLKREWESISLSGLKLYGNIIKFKYIKDKERAALLKKGEESITKLMDRDRRIQHLVVPYELLDRILCHLNNNDLQNLIRCAGIL